MYKSRMRQNWEKLKQQKIVGHDYLSGLAKVYYEEDNYSYLPERKKVTGQNCWNELGKSWEEKYSFLSQLSALAWGYSPIQSSNQYFLFATSIRLSNLCCYLRFGFHLPSYPSLLTSLASTCNYVNVSSSSNVPVRVNYTLPATQPSLALQKMLIRNTLGIMDLIPWFRKMDWWLPPKWPMVRRSDRCHLFTYILTFNLRKHLYG